MKKNDIYLIWGLVAILVVSYLLVQLIRANGGVVVVTINKEEYSSYSLHENNVILLSSGNDNINMLVIRDGYAYIDEASCRDKLCVNHIPISKAGEMIICLPNEVVVQVKKGSKSKIDAITLEKQDNEINFGLLW